MRFRLAGLVLLAVVFASAGAAQARVNTVVVRNGREGTTAAYQFKVIASPSDSDAAAHAKIIIARGERDRNSGDVEKLMDGKGATRQDQPRENLFFSDGTEGGRLLVDLTKPIAIEQVNTYSWHPGERGPQVYRLYGMNGKDDSSIASASQEGELEKSGWRLITKVDSRGGEAKDRGGQYGVSIFDSDGALGTYRYLLFDVVRADKASPFGNTFYSEIDVIGESPAEPARDVTLVEAGSGKYQITIDTSGSSDLTEWAKSKLAPIVEAWYPKIVAMLPSDGFVAPRKLTITISDDIGGVAAASGTSIRCNGSWFRQNLAGEARGAIVHEMVHVVQQYGRARRPNRPPGWLVEGIADYVRWFLYEPESRGAEITGRNIARAEHDASYRISANFLNWVCKKHGDEFPQKLNAALREGKYHEELWDELTGQNVDELAAEWKVELERELASAPAGNEAPQSTESDAG